MAVGINGMGRIGRLALRAAFGAMERPPTIRAPATARYRASERDQGSGRDGASSRIRQPAWLLAEIGADHGAICIDNRRSLTGAAAPGGAVGRSGCDIVLECRQIPEAISCRAISTRAWSGSLSRRR
jgi:glyceraldehyde 3-phosphate dehydrogenase